MTLFAPRTLPGSSLVPSARARGVAALFAAAGALISTDPFALALAWACVMIPLMWGAGVLRQHARFIGVVLGPIALVSVFVWAVLVGAPPGAAPGTAPGLGLRYAATVVFRLALLGAITQAVVLSIRPDDLPRVLNSWGIRGDSLAITLGCFAMIPELRLRAEQVVTARYARGLVRSRRPWSRLAQLPHVLLPLFAWTLRAAVQRSDAWRERGTLALIVADDAAPAWQAADPVYVAAGAAWVVYAGLSL